MEGIWQDLQAVLQGGFTFRYIVQPVIAILLGIRDGRMDAHAGKPPELYRFFFGTGGRLKALKGALHATIKPTIVGIAIDVILQMRVLKNYRPGFTVVAVGILVGLPYALARSITNQILQHRMAARGKEPPAAGTGGGETA